MRCMSQRTKMQKLLVNPPHPSQVCGLNVCSICMKKVQGSSRFPLIPHQLCFVCEGKFYIQKSDQLFKQRFDIIETQTQSTSDDIRVLEVEIKVLEEQITKQTIDE